MAADRRRGARMGALPRPRAGGAVLPGPRQWEGLVRADSRALEGRRLRTMTDGKDAIEVSHRERHADDAEQVGGSGGAAGGLAVQGTEDDEGVESVNGQTVAGATSGGGAAVGTSAVVPMERQPRSKRKKTLFEKAEAFVSRLASKNN